MKAVAYSIQPYEKEFLAIANHKKHDITLISNALHFDTVTYAAGKDAVIVSNADLVSSDIIKILASLHIKYIISRSADMAYIDQQAAARCGITLTHAEPAATGGGYLTIANQMINELDLFQIADAALKASKKISFH